MTGNGYAGCDGCGCSTPPEPPECETTCCESGYPDELKVWLQWNQTDILECTCDPCPSGSPFQVTLTKDPTPTWSTLNNAECGAILGGLDGIEYVTPTCISATYSASFSSGCLCCDSCESPIVGWCVRYDVEVFATYGISSYEDIEDPEACTIEVDIIVRTYWGPDCDNLQLCSYVRSFHLAIDNSTDLCDCGFYDLTRFGAWGGYCTVNENCSELPLPAFPLCGVALAIVVPGHDEYGQVEVPC